MKSRENRHSLQDGGAESTGFGSSTLRIGVLLARGSKFDLVKEDIRDGIVRIDFGNNATQCNILSCFEITDLLQYRAVIDRNTIGFDMRKLAVRTALDRNRSRRNAGNISAFDLHKLADVFLRSAAPITFDIIQNFVDADDFIRRMTGMIFLVLFRCAGPRLFGEDGRRACRTKEMNFDKDAATDDC